MLIEKTQQEYLEIIKKAILENTEIKTLSPASFIYKLANAFANVGITISDIWNKSLINSLLSYATGNYLDLIGQSMNITRRGTEYAQVFETENNFCFYVDTGTFGNINSGNNILVPAGTIISTEPDINGEKTKFIITSDIILLASEQKHYFSAEATKEGEIVLAPHTVIEHTVASYADAINNTLKVTNEKPIAAGQYIESDDEYRYRISNALLSFQAGNKQAILSSLTSVPGIADIKIINNEKGLGTANVYIMPQIPGPDESIVRIAKNVIEPIKTLGSDIGVYNPKFIGIELSCTLVFSENTPEHEKPHIRKQVQENIIKYINNIPIGEPLIIAQLIKEILNTSDYIIKLHNNTFDSFYAYKPTVYNNRIRLNIYKDIYVQEYEKILIEYTIKNPVVVK